MTPTLELRVLKGLHREARCAIGDDATIGSDPACDIVLSDEGVAPRAAQIRLRENGWLLITDDPSSESQTPISWNRAVPLGHAWITVAQEDTPWVFTDETDLEDAEGLLSAREEVSNLGSGDIGHATAGTFHAQPSGRGWLTMLVSIAVALVIFSAIGVAVVSNGTYSSQNPLKNTTAEQSLGQISAALGKLGLASTLHVTLSKAGTVTVSGWVRDQEQYEAVASAMSQIWPMPALRISLESEAILTARGILQRFSVKYDPLYQGNGRLEIVGVASTARERALALDAVRVQLPGLTVLGNTIELAQEVSDALAQKLSGLGISGVTLIWQPGHLQVQPPELDEAQEAVFEDAIEDFNKRYWNIARAGDVPEAPVADSVPFKIRSVISGPQPFIVLADGTKLLVGGTYRRYQLTAIEDSRIIFDGPRRAIVTR